MFILSKKKEKNKGKTHARLRRTEHPSPALKPCWLGHLAAVIRQKSSILELEPGRVSNRKKRVL